ncbi:DNA polymerase III subunit delta' [Alcaligenes pakistanensis]|uniref:DNA polymerase III subunit delta n=1 Tax=Alcaligenes pakistanensis TaxID=1482717 RepID=A0A8H9M646_9BURK|nr:DNA polymerase III subunit delta' [Alcaligenes pakistanensis]MBP6622438.1 DNA polymerase III subunit delta' [Alcaligenes sp.]GHC35991.1 DNA polymerase III subunit delta' [Alcaligenes pakistanensis]HCA17457.1 DNA polymerase III subunit delta' [Alcaligenes faecalis]
MSDSLTFLPWQIETAQAWLGTRERFAHAWLIHGLPGIGKTQFARAAAASLLCDQPVQGLACGQCQACQWVRGGNHPDLRLLRPDAVALEEQGPDTQEGDLAKDAAARKNPSREIRVEQLRQLQHWFNTATHRGGWRVAVLYPAQALNLVSANALLKVLEEPAERTVFLLVADAPDRLLPTLVSRCRRLPLPAPDAQQSTQWLEQQGLGQAADWLAAWGGAPLKALSASQQMSAPCPEWLSAWMDGVLKAGREADLSLADTLEKLPAQEWIDYWQRLFVDIQLGSFGQSARYYPSLQKRIDALAVQSNPTAVAEALKWLVQQRALGNHPLNAKLFIHHALDRLHQACRRV